MRVYQINVVCGSGSTGRIATELSHAIQEHGGVSRIAYGRGECTAEGIDCIKIAFKADTYIHAFLTRMTDRHGLYSKKATQRLVHDIESYTPDIIHLHNLHGYYLNYERLFGFLKTYDRPVVWTMHDCWAFTGHCAHYDAAKCGKWKEGCCQCPILYSYPATLYGGNVHDNYERKKKCFTSVPKMTIVTPSRWLKDQISQSFLKDLKCITIPNGINLKQFKPRESNLRQRMQCEGKILILGVTSVWTRNKGLEDFIQLRQMLDSRYVICMVGLTGKQIRKLPDGIIGKAKTESVEELAQYYSAADVFLNLTYEDTFPTVNIEALACGTPVITYRTGGSAEIIVSDCGSIVDKGNLAAVCEQIEKLCGHEKIKSACEKRAKEFCDQENCEKYVALYNDVTR